MKPIVDITLNVITVMCQRLVYILALTIFLTACFPSPPSFVPMRDSKPEALRWLNENSNPSALAENRFGSTVEAIAFVQSLYEMGAEAVYIDGIREEYWRKDLVDDPYADALLVYLPDDPTKRATLFVVFQREYEDQGLNPVIDQGQEQVLLWWD